MPRRTKGLGSLIKLKNSPFWQARFYDQMGRKISISTKTTVKQVAEAFLRKQMADVRDRGLAPLSDMRRITYRDLRAGLLANYTEKGNKSLKMRPNGEETITGLPQLDAFFKFSSENPGPSVVQIGTDTARKFVEERQAEGAGNAVINRSLACLRRMLRIAHEDGKLQAVPVIRLLKEPPARRGFVALPQFEDLVAKLPAHLQPYITFLYFCGGRSGEAELIDWTQVDLDRAIIRLEDDQTKNKEPRFVPLPERLVLMLAATDKKEGRVFDTTNVRKEWMTACAAAGLGRKIKVEGKPYDPKYEGLTIHDLRRSAARNLLLAGVPETIIMRIGGWKTRSVFDRYAVANTADLTAAMQRWEIFAQNLPTQTVRYNLVTPKTAKRTKALKA
ncbi:MAG TPA: site-specific integrase [Candidatus Dormibacteraeota bacterium]|nr:site-specific integrase [Candidatus Dormibacteraeota bacterium]